jgi:hypothetical protein
MNVRETNYSNFNFLSFNDTQTDVVGAADSYYGAMNRAAAERGLTIQLCMGLPALTLAVGLAIGLSGLPLAIALICAATPTAPNSYVLARELGGDTTLAANFIGPHRHRRQCGSGIGLRQSSHGERG